MSSFLSQSLSGGVIDIESGTKQKPTIVTHSMSPYPILSTDSLLLCDVVTAPAGPIIVTWPAVATMDNRRVSVVDWTDGASVAVPITIAVTDSTINGVASVAITDAGGGAEVYCHGGIVKTLKATT